MGDWKLLLNVWCSGYYSDDNMEFIEVRARMNIYLHVVCRDRLTSSIVDTFSLSNSTGTVELYLRHLPLVLIVVARSIIPS